MYVCFQLRKRKRPKVCFYFILCHTSQSYPLNMRHWIKYAVEMWIVWPCARVQVLTALFLRIQIFWGKIFSLEVSGTRHVYGEYEPDICREVQEEDTWLLGLEYKGNTFIPGVGNNLPNVTSSYPRKHELTNSSTNQPTNQPTDQPTDRPTT
jgi:hypothetical protein